MVDVLQGPACSYALSCLSVRDATALASVDRDRAAAWLDQDQASRLSLPTVALCQLTALVGASKLLRWYHEALVLQRRLETLNTPAPLPIAAARLNGTDIFAACKRAYITGQMGWADSPVLGAWMQVVEAVEENCLSMALPVLVAGVNSVEASQALHGEHIEVASEGKQQAVTWMLQLAHYFEDLPALAQALNSEWRIHLVSVEEELQQSPLVGEYTQGPRLTHKHVRRLMNALDRRC